MAVITRIYKSHEDAAATVTGLEAVGLGHEEISVIGCGPSGPAAAAAGSADDTQSGTGAAAAATAGTVLGGGAGLLAGLGALAIPGIGPVVAAGWLVATLTGAGVGAAVGAGAGGLVGSLVKSGETEEDAEVYAESVRRGCYLVTAMVDDKRVGEAHRILSNRGADAAQQRATYQQTGWSKFDATAAPYQAAENATVR